MRKGQNKVELTPSPRLRVKLLITVNSYRGRIPLDFVDLSRLSHFTAQRKTAKRQVKGKRYGHLVFPW